MKSFNVALGLDYIPFSAEVDKITGTTTTNATVEIKDVWTAYVQPSKNIGNGYTVFAKLGYTSGDLNVSNITQVAGQSYNTANTTLSASKKLEGPMYGIGLQKIFLTKCL